MVQICCWSPVHLLVACGADVVGVEVPLEAFEAVPLQEREHAEHHHNRGQNGPVNRQDEGGLHKWMFEQSSPVLHVLDIVEVQEVGHRQTHQVEELHVRVKVRSSLSSGVIVKASCVLSERVVKFQLVIVTVQVISIGQGC